MTYDERHAWDLYAAAALAGIWACDNVSLTDEQRNHIEAYAAESADTMLEERRLRTSKPCEPTTP